MENPGDPRTQLWVFERGQGAASLLLRSRKGEIRKGLGCHKAQPGQEQLPALFTAFGMMLQSLGCRERGLEPPSWTREGGQAQGMAGCKAEGFSINDCSPFFLYEGKRGRDDVPDPIPGMRTACVWGGSPGKILNPHHTPRSSQRQPPWLGQHPSSHSLPPQRDLHPEVL